MKCFKCNGEMPSAEYAYHARNGHCSGCGSERTDERVYNGSKILKQKEREEEIKNAKNNS
jgi:ribosomal protein L37E